MSSCQKCGRILSSQQALNYHLTSKSCKNTSVASDPILMKLTVSCQTHIKCTLDGVIMSVINKRDIKSFREVEHIGFSIYSFIKESQRFPFSMEHIKALTNRNETIHNCFVNDLLGGDKKFRTIIYMTDILNVFQFKHSAGDLHLINDSSPVQRRGSGSAVVTGTNFSVQ